MTTSVDGKSFSGISANTPQFYLKGGFYVVSAIGTITTSVELQMLGPDGATFVSLPTPLKVTTSGGTAGGNAPPGQYRFTLTSATGVSCSVAGVPIS
jgi:hypothetical protein